MAKHVLHRDYESRGVLKLEDVGAWRYAADPRTEILCCAYAVDDDPVKLWIPGEPVPPEFEEAMNTMRMVGQALDCFVLARCPTGR